MQWCSYSCHRNDDDNKGESFNYSMGSYVKHKAWCAGFFGEFLEAFIYIVGVVDSDIVMNYISAGGGEGPKAGELPPAKKS